MSQVTTTTLTRTNGSVVILGSNELLLAAWVRSVSPSLVREPLDGTGSVAYTNADLESRSSQVHAAHVSATATSALVASVTADVPALTDDSRSAYFSALGSGRTVQATAGGTVNRYIFPIVEPGGSSATVNYRDYTYLGGRDTTAQTAAAVGYRSHTMVASDEMLDIADVYDVSSHATARMTQRSVPDLSPSGIWMSRSSLTGMVRNGDDSAVLYRGPSIGRTVRWRIEAGPYWYIYSGSGKPVVNTAEVLTFTITDVVMVSAGDRNYRAIMGQFRTGFESSRFLLNTPDGPMTLVDDATVQIFQGSNLWAGCGLSVRSGLIVRYPDGSLQFSGESFVTIPYNNLRARYYEDVDVTLHHKRNPLINRMVERLLRMSRADKPYTSAARELVINFLKALHVGAAIEGSDSNLYIIVDDESWTPKQVGSVPWQNVVVKHERAVGNISPKRTVRVSGVTYEYGTVMSTSAAGQAWVPPALISSPELAAGFSAGGEISADTSVRVAVVNVTGAISNALFVKSGDGTTYMAAIRKWIDVPIFPVASELLSPRMVGWLDAGFFTTAVKPSEVTREHIILDAYSPTLLTVVSTSSFKASLAQFLQTRPLEMAVFARTGIACFLAARRSSDSKIAVWTLPAVRRSTFVGQSKRLSSSKPYKSTAGFFTSVETAPRDFLVRTIYDGLGEL